MSRAVLLLLVSGCFGIPDEIDQQDLPKDGAAVVCSRLRECTRGLYDSTYFGRSDCRDEEEVRIQDIVQGADGDNCAYSAAGAGDALQEIDDMSCEDFVDGEADEALFLIWGDDCF
jgi:hypothetical protein